jgi:hypothetical protein
MSYMNPDVWGTYLLYLLVIDMPTVRQSYLLHESQRYTCIQDQE